MKSYIRTYDTELGEMNIPAPKFAVGDTVMAVEQICNDIKKGAVVTVLELRSDDCYIVGYLGGSALANGWEIKPYTKPTPPGAPAKEEPKEGQLFEIVASLGAAGSKGEIVTFVRMCDRFTGSYIVTRESGNKRQSIHKCYLKPCEPVAAHRCDFVRWSVTEDLQDYESTCEIPGCGKTDRHHEIPDYYPQPVDWKFRAQLAMPIVADLVKLSTVISGNHFEASITEKDAAEFALGYVDAVITKTRCAEYPKEVAAC
jgi:hypothetical protein